MGWTIEDIIEKEIMVVIDGGSIRYVYKEDEGYDLHE